MEFIKLRDYRNYKSYSLDNVSSEVLGENKVSINQLPIEIYNSGDYDLLKEYNDMDVLLIKRLNDVQHWVEVGIKFSELTHTKVSSLNSTVGPLNSLFKEEFGLSKLEAPHKPPKDILKNFGGYNLPTHNEIYKGRIEYIDLDSLYPSIFVEFKDYLDSRVGDWIEQNIEDRKIAKSKDNFSLQYALKILNNSLYGYLSNKYAIYYHPEYASFITLVGRLVIKLTVEVINRFVDTANCVFTSTDSVAFVIDNMKPVDEIISNVHNFIDNFVEYIKDIFKEKDMFLGISKEIYDNKNQVLFWEDRFVDRFLEDHSAGLPSKNDACKIRFSHEKTLSSLMLSGKIKDYSYTMEHDFDKIYFTGSVVNRSTASQIIKDIYAEYVKRLHQGLEDFSTYKDEVNVMIEEHDNLMDHAIKYKISKDYKNYKNSVSKSYKAEAVQNSLKQGIISDVNSGDSYFILEFDQPVFNNLSLAFTQEQLVQNEFDISVDQLDLRRITRDVNKELKKLFKRFSYVLVEEPDKQIQRKLDDYFS
jgi:DNA polymerase elongation subunit (family B)